VNYTPEQKLVIEKVRARTANPLWFWWHNKTPRTIPYIIDTNGKKKKVTDKHILLKRLNNFEGWECNVGVDWFAIKIDGTISGICSNALYKDAVKFNIYDTEFPNNFKPTIAPSICTQSGCWCGFETNMPKRKIDFTNNYKVIPIHAN
jgi:hypothetical protein